mmetsp:Transcript_8752/g.10035  ORF Transcript_8752/g.10035 Transcript_8752/m.10035 type:complete len:297 (+) Transcript_8752:52-942(+)
MTMNQIYFKLLKERRESFPGTTSNNNTSTATRSSPASSRSRARTMSNGGGNNYGAIAIDTYNDAEDNTSGSGRLKPFSKERKCNDVLFALLFVSQLAFIIAQIFINGGGGDIPNTTTTTNTTKEIEEMDTIIDSIDNVIMKNDVMSSMMTSSLFKFLMVTNTFALGMGILVLGILMSFTTILVELALGFVLLLLASMTIYSYAYVNNTWMSILFGIIFVVATIYTICVQRRIPFAAANLRTALTAIRTNCGMVIMSFLWEIVAFGYIYLWMSSFIIVTTSTINTISKEDDDDDENT